MKKYLESELNVEFTDEGPWRSYRLYTSGRYIQDFIDNASIEEIDKDGGTLRTYELDKSSDEVLQAAIKIILKQ